MIQPTNSLAKTASWVVIENLTGKAVFETFQESVAKKINQTKYTAVPILKYLQSLNRGKV